ncbi:MAG: NgoMIV family type II restriction endonuclease [Dehalococcoidia bacterium]|jgi:hypothetical protein
MLISKIRAEYHTRICREIIRYKGDKKLCYLNFADSGNRSSIQIALEITKQLNQPIGKGIVTEQGAGKLFEQITRDYLEKTFKQMNQLRPGNWNYCLSRPISSYTQYQHLSHIDSALKKDKVLHAALRGDYIVKPDIVISRFPVSDAEINRRSLLINEMEDIATLTPLRAHNQENEILHASISCKWTIRSDRSQNTRTEALNLIRHRKGNLPHVVAVTAEPLPTRIAALALGTGDLDCVYHFALTELKAAIESLNNQDQFDMLHIMIQGNRLRDISDLPFDLAV